MASLRLHTSALLAALVALGLLPAAAPAGQTGGVAPEVSPGAGPPPAAEDPLPVEPQLGSGRAPPPAGKARIVAGKAVPPRNAPRAVVAAIQAANRIVDKPYRRGGGHATVEDTAYDCSGAVSYALRAAGVLQVPLSSGPFVRWGAPGPGRWITVYARPGHAFAVIAGLRLDTGRRDRNASRYGSRPGRGPRWGQPRSTIGFAARHAPGL